MSEQYTGQLAEVAMTEGWKRWEGQTVHGEFELGEYLGGSEHSAVFQTHYDDRDPQKAAIKLVADDSTNSDKWLESWQIASTLSHPNLIQIFQMGRCQIGDARLLYVVMESVEEDLSQIVPQRALTENEASEMLKPALDALAYLHARGLVHGRIKPTNIMASGDQLKLSTDRIRRASEPIIDPGDYVPPEGIWSPAGDVWSIGMTLVEVLTQSLPKWDRNVEDDPQVTETGPSPLLDVARHCLRRDPTRRWTIGNIANRLKVPAAAQRAVQPIQQNSSRTQSWFLIAAVILLLGLARLVSLKLLNHSPRANAELSQGIEKPTAQVSPAVGTDDAPSKEKPREPSAEQVSGVTAQVITPARSAEASPVSGGDASVSGILHQVLPDVPQKPRDTIRGTVRVGITVSVDGMGNVTDAEIDSPGPSMYFANLARRDALQWKFAPTRDAASNWMLRFNFSADGTTVSAKRSSR